MVRLVVQWKAYPCDPMFGRDTISNNILIVPRNGMEIDGTYSNQTHSPKQNNTYF